MNSIRTYITKGLLNVVKNDLAVFSKCRPNVGWIPDHQTLKVVFGAFRCTFRVCEVCLVTGESRD